MGWDEAPVVRIDGRRIRDRESFHDVFAEAFGFPGFYGRNMDAWIDCMSCLDDPESGMTNVWARPGRVVTVLVEHAAEFASGCAEMYGALVEMTAFVNWRRIERGDGAVIALAFEK